MKIRAYITHKLEENNSDCQDYFRIDSSRKKIAISDGVSQSIFSAKWAQMLVKEYTDSDCEDISTQLLNLQKQWQDFAQSELERLEKEGESTWMLENCLAEKQGAAATFCGIKIADDGKWIGYALGDSCLLEISEDSRILNFYPSVKKEFGNSPDYFDSFTEGKGKLCKISGKLSEGQKLLMVTDPFGELLFNKKNDNTESSYISKLLSLNSYEEFLALVDGLRTTEKMHNDDSTLVIVENDGLPSFEVEEKTLEHLLENEKEQTLLMKKQTNNVECMNRKGKFKAKNLPKCCQRCKHKNGVVNWVRNLFNEYK